jgi:hypothetical protein
VDWLPGYEGARPVRIGNAAAGQFQLDVYGEVMSALYESVQAGDPDGAAAWELQRALLEFLETGWREPDDGIWEVRGPRRHFTHSKVMAWVAFDRAIRTVEEHEVEGPVDRWREIRQEIHDQVCDLGFNPDKGSFTQYYGSDQLDASLLMIPLVGFLPATDPRVRGTIEAVERELVEGDFVLRYRTVDTGDIDGLTGREGAFLACSFWLADCLTLLGREHDARQLLARLLDLRNDLGLLSEEYDPVAGRLVGNFPQAFSHVSLVNSAAKITGNQKPSPSHVFLGLARQALTGPRPTGRVRRHAAVTTAGRSLSDLVGRAGVRAPTGTVGPDPGRPTRKRSVQREVPRKGGAPHMAAKKSTAKKSTAKKATAKKSTAKKATAKKSTAKVTTAKKPATEDAVAVKKSTAAKKSTVAKKSTAKKRS